MELIPELKEGLERCSHSPTGIEYDETLEMYPSPNNPMVSSEHSKLVISACTFYNH
jgi:hypothetical protein